MYSENFLTGWFWPNMYTDLALLSLWTWGVPKRLVITINVWKIKHKINNSFFSQGFISFIPVGKRVKLLDDFIYRKVFQLV